MSYFTLENSPIWVKNVKIFNLKKSVIAMNGLLGMGNINLVSHNSTPISSVLNTRLYSPNSKTSYLNTVTKASNKRVVVVVVVGSCVKGGN